MCSGNNNCTEVPVDQCVNIPAQIVGAVEQNLYVSNGIIKASGLVTNSGAGGATINWHSGGLTGPVVFSLAIPPGPGPTAPPTSIGWTVRNFDTIGASSAPRPGTTIQLLVEPVYSIV